jgi:phenylacetate-coenzyme A ligase PaaK-like adenylate-forming protein
MKTKANGQSKRVELGHYIVADPLMAKLPETSTPLTTRPHIFEDYFYPEAVDPKTGKPCAEEKEGELVLTTLVK